MNLSKGNATSEVIVKNGLKYNYGRNPQTLYDERIKKEPHNAH